MTKRQTHRVRLGALAGAGVLVLAAGIALVSADSGEVDVQVADNTHSVINEPTEDGALVSYIGDGDTSFGSSGTGVFESFVRLQADGTEAGYNTNGTLQFDTKSGKWTHAIKVSDIPVVAVEGTPYWELWADINESNSKSANASHISLDKLEVYFADSATVTGYPTFSGHANPEYLFDGAILINDVNQGSGRGDLRYYVPVSGIEIPDSCSYKNPACNTWFVLYSKWGGAPGAANYASDGGFEEWKVKQYPYVYVSKTATPSFTRTHTWEIDKSVDKDSYSLFDGQSGESTYSVKVTKTTTDSDYAVSGNITITNPGKANAMITSVTDVISGPISVEPSCPVTFPYTLVAGGTLTCTYSSALPNADTRTNTATVMLDYGGLFKGTAPIDFTGVTPTVVGYDSIDVTDTYGGALGSTNATKTFPYKRTFDCSGIEYTDGSGSKTYPNTATITQTGQSDSASVAVTCYRLSVSKDATPTFTRTYEWTIDKSVDKDTHTLFDGQTGDSNYSVTVTKTTTDSAWAVSGNITITNPAPKDATVSSLLDDISGLAGDPTPSCPSTTVPAGGTLVCTYTSALPNADSRTNTATAIAYGVSYTSNVAPIDFSGVTPTVVGYDSIDVTDTYGGALGSTNATKTFPYKRTFDCSGIEYTDGSGSKTYPNTATITQTGQSDSASVAVTCYRLSVDKTATTSYDRDFDWTITKSVDKGELTLQNGASTTVNYTIVATKSAAQDSNFAVSGKIEVSNPAPIDATLTSVSDSISGIGVISISCPASLTVPAGGKLTCTYSKALPDKTSRTNTATVVAYTKSYTDDAAVTFGDPTNVTDNCATVTDSLKGSLGTICETTTFNYSRTVGPYFDCDDYTVNNTAKVTEVDSGDYDTDSASVLIHVVGCGNLFHTGTTCAQYYLGAPPVGLAGTQIDTVEYSVKSGLINQVNPGVFFYYTDFTAASGTASVKINQLPPGSYDNPMAVQNNNQVRVYDASCNTYTNFTFGVADGDVTLNISGLTAGSDYIISVKYDPGNLVGLAPPASPSVTYAWQTEFGGGSFGWDSLDLKLK